MSWALLLARVLMAALFIQDGFAKATAPTATMAAFVKLNLPMPGAVYAVALLAELGGGVAFLLGWRTRTAALVLSVWCLATAFGVHYRPDDRAQMLLFLAYLCMAGGFLQVLPHGAGRFSVDRQ